MESKEAQRKIECELARNVISHVGFDRLVEMLIKTKQDGETWTDALDKYSTFISVYYNEI